MASDGRASLRNVRIRAIHSSAVRGCATNGSCRSDRVPSTRGVASGARARCDEAAPPLCWGAGGASGIARIAPVAFLRCSNGADTTAASRSTFDSGRCSGAVAFAREAGGAANAAASGTAAGGDATDAAGGAVAGDAGAGSVAGDAGDAAVAALSRLTMGRAGSGRNDCITGRDASASRRTAFASLAGGGAGWLADERDGVAAFIGESLVAGGVCSTSVGASGKMPTTTTPIAAAAASGIHQRHGWVARAGRARISPSTARWAAASTAASTAGGGVSAECVRSNASSAVS